MCNCTQLLKPHVPHVHIYRPISYPKTLSLLLLTTNSWTSTRNWKQPCSLLKSIGDAGRSISSDYSDHNLLDVFIFKAVAEAGATDEIDITDAKQVDAVRSKVPTVSASNHYIVICLKLI